MTRLCPICRRLAGNNPPWRRIPHERLQLVRRPGSYDDGGRLRWAENGFLRAPVPDNETNRRLFTRIVLQRCWQSEALRAASRAGIRDAERYRALVRQQKALPRLPGSF